MRDWLACAEPGIDVEAFLAAGRFVHEDGRAVTREEPYRPCTFVWFHRDLRDEPVVPGDLVVLHQDERVVVVDKPHFLATVPRGRHVVQSVVVRAREALGLPDLTPAHRLDRLTAGLVLLTTEPRWRAPYQRLFEQRLVAKEYEALAPARDVPRVVRNRIEKRPGDVRAHVVPGEPNAQTHLELVSSAGGIGRYRLRPTTGRTHQLRLHLAGLGAPILGDPLYPVVRDVDVDDFREPLRLLARRLAFTDPVDGSPRVLESSRALAPEPLSSGGTGR